jgi:hypothetical protein
MLESRSLEDVAIRAVGFDLDKISLCRESTISNLENNLSIFFKELYLLGILGYVLVEPLLLGTFR